MEKHEFFKCIELHKRLKEKVKGGVFIGIKNGTMTVSISGFRRVRYTKFYNNLPDWIDYDKVADELYYDYRKFILEKFCY